MKRMCQGISVSVLTAAMVSAASVFIGVTNVGVTVTQTNRHQGEGTLETNTLIVSGGHRFPLQGGTPVKWWTEIRQLAEGVIGEEMRVSVGGQSFLLQEDTRVTLSSMLGKAELHTVTLKGGHDIPTEGVLLKAGPGIAQFSKDSINNFRSTEQEFVFSGWKIKLDPGCYVGLTDGYINGKKVNYLWNVQRQMFSSGGSLKSASPSLEIWGQMSRMSRISFDLRSHLLKDIEFGTTNTVMLAGASVRPLSAQFNEAGKLAMIKFGDDAVFKVGGIDMPVKKGTAIYLTNNRELMTIIGENIRSSAPAANTQAPADKTAVNTATNAGTNSTAASTGFPAWLIGKWLYDEYPGVKSRSDQKIYEFTADNKWVITTVRYKRTADQMQTLARAGFKTVTASDAQRVAITLTGRVNSAIVFTKVSDTEVSVSGYGYKKPVTIKKQ